MAQVGWALPANRRHTADGVRWFAKHVSSAMSGQKTPFILTHAGSLTRSHALLVLVFQVWVGIGLASNALCSGTPTM